MNHSTHSKLAVVAIGGNALLRDDLQPDMMHQWETARTLSSYIANMIEDGWTIVVTHGNGPQVGYNLRRNELASPEVYPLSFDLLVAHTQGSIGLLIQQSLQNELRSRNIDRPCVAMVTQVLVDANDPGFVKPTKPIGGFLNQLRAHAFELEGWQVVFDSGRGWRRVVASPEPLEIIEEAAIRQAVEQGWIVICVGGGGVPVMRSDNGELRSATAVIDKDRASALLASKLNADLLLISTGIEKVAVNFGKPDQRWLDSMTVSEAEQYMAEGQFPPGSMGPKIEACLRFIKMSENPNAVALITDPPNLAKGLRGETGTRLVRA